MTITSFFQPMRTCSDFIYRCAATNHTLHRSHQWGQGVEWAVQVGRSPRDASAAAHETANQRRRHKVQDNRNTHMCTCKAARETGTQGLNVFLPQRIHWLLYSWVLCIRSHLHNEQRLCKGGVNTGPPCSRGSSIL